MFSFDLFERRKSIHFATVMNARLVIGRRNMKHRTSRENHCPFNDICISRMFPGQGPAHSWFQKRLCLSASSCFEQSVGRSAGRERGCLRHVPVGPEHGLELHSAYKTYRREMFAPRPLRPNRDWSQQ
jgi:hypothetical protein